MSRGELTCGHERILGNLELDHSHLRLGAVLLELAEEGVVGGFVFPGRTSDDDGVSLWRLDRRRVRLRRDDLSRVELLVRRGRHLVSDRVKGHREEEKHSLGEP